MKTKKLIKIFLMALSGSIGSILMGIIFLGFVIFTPSTPSFQFVTFGFFGALFFSLFEYNFLKEQILVFIVILVLQLVIFSGRYINLDLVIRDLFFLGSLFISILLYQKFIKRYTRLKLYIRSLALVVIYALLNILFGLLVFIINTNNISLEPRLIYLFARNAILIGLGIGLGVDFYIQNKAFLFNLLRINSLKSI
ncbi:MAG: hypothetical protein IPH11_11075 [Ignavibacteriales bacterium]|nr:hypothetical protein [Ignavibacteriales bacterium]